jgi:hypothetical protein
MGMRHDFGSDPSIKRFDSKQNACSGVGGVMDYYGNVNKWSPCSVEDFAGYVNRIISSNGNFCLETLSIGKK